MTSVTFDVRYIHMSILKLINIHTRSACSYHRVFESVAGYRSLSTIIGFIFSVSIIAAHILVSFWWQLLPTNYPLLNTLLVSHAHYLLLPLAGMISDQLSRYILSSSLSFQVWMASIDSKLISVFPIDVHLAQCDKKIGAYLAHMHAAFTVCQKLCCSTERILVAVWAVIIISLEGSEQCFNPFKCTKFSHAHSVSALLSASNAKCGITYLVTY